MTSEEIRVDARDYLQRINQVIKDIKLNPLNWIVSEIEREDGTVSKVEFKPLDVSSYCKKLFEKCNRTLIMSATIGRRHILQKCGTGLEGCKIH